MKRAAGVLLPITSLPSDYGIGTLGRQARKFIDFLVRARQSYWQVLPIGPTGYGDSPYQTFCSYAGNAYLIDLDDLHERGYLKPSEYQPLNWGSSPSRIDYGRMYTQRYAVLHEAASRLNDHPTPEYQDFLAQEGYWLNDYALFMALKFEHGGSALQKWPEAERRREYAALQAARQRLAAEVSFWEAVQYFFFAQWKKLKQYANDRGIELIGDLPIYAALDSVEVWTEPQQFQLNQDYLPDLVSGCPPDAFSPAGQVWGNPLYNWEAMKQDHYDWWCRRMVRQRSFYDVLRIDHFRGIAGYYCIPAGDPDARNGHWTKGPGLPFLEEVQKQIGPSRFIAEDLGYLTPDVLELLRQSGFPGMRVLEFAFDNGDPDCAYLPHRYIPNCVAYTGTHDNDTCLGWLHTAPKSVAAMAKDYLHLNREEPANWTMIRALYQSVADTVIIPMQDLLGLGSEARINTPSTFGGNWLWRCDRKAFSAALARKLAAMVWLYGRC